MGRCIGCLFAIVLIGFNVLIGPVNAAFVENIGGDFYWHGNKNFLCLYSGSTYATFADVSSSVILKNDNNCLTVCTLTFVAGGKKEETVIEKGNVYIKKNKNTGQIYYSNNNSEWRVLTEKNEIRAAYVILQAVTGDYSVSTDQLTEQSYLASKKIDMIFDKNTHFAILYPSDGYNLNNERYITKGNVFYHLSYPDFNVAIMGKGYEGIYGNYNQYSGMLIKSMTDTVVRGYIVDDILDDKSEPYKIIRKIYLHDDTGMKCYILMVYSTGKEIHSGAVYISMLDKNNNDINIPYGKNYYSEELEKIVNRVVDNLNLW